MQFYCADYHQVLAVVNQGSSRKDPYAVRRACNEWTRLILARKAVRLEMADQGLLPVLHDLVQPLVDEHELVLADCVHLLRRMISLKEPTELDIQTRITDAGFLPLLASGLQCHPDCARLFTETCALVAVMCFDTPGVPHADNQSAMAEQGLLQMLSQRLAACVKEDEALQACEAIFAAIYEHESIVQLALRDFGIISMCATVLDRFSDSPRIVQAICRTLFQLIALEASAQSDVVEAGFLQRALDCLEGIPLERHILLQWHMYKLFEIAMRHSDDTKDEFIRCRGHSILINALAQTKAGKDRNPTLRSALSYIACLLFCDLALTSDSPVVHKDRVGRLMAAGVHEFALSVVKEHGGVAHIAEQAIRLLEIIATIESHRIPLTRIGASRQVKLVYNSTSQSGLLALCERAVAAIEGT